MSDPSHRKKVIGKNLYKLVNQRVIKKVDYESLKKNWGYMVSQINNMDTSNGMTHVVSCSKEVLKTNDHKYCRNSWCYALQEKEKQREYLYPSYYK